MSMKPSVPNMIDVPPETHKLFGLRGLTFTNAVRLWGAANLPSSADVLASA
jgi:hypothetical protein